MGNLNSVHSMCVEAQTATEAELGSTANLLTLVEWELWER